jgi:hypothetical protein
LRVGRDDGEVQIAFGADERERDGGGSTGSPMLGGEPELLALSSDRRESAVSTQAKKSPEPRRF